MRKSLAKSMLGVISSLFVLFAAFSMNVTDEAVAEETKTQQQSKKCQDSIIKSQIETAVSMLQAIYSKKRMENLHWNRQKNLAQTCSGICVTVRIKAAISGRTPLMA